MSRSHTGCLLHTCSITRPIIAGGCIACSPKPASTPTIPICRSCRSEARCPRLRSLRRKSWPRWRLQALGKQGSITALLKTLGAMAPDERKTQGPLINALKDRFNSALAERREAFRRAALEARLNTETIDVTLPVREAPFESGRVHPITQVVDE